MLGLLAEEQAMLYNSHQWSAESDLVVQTYDPATQEAETIGSPV